MTWRKSSYSTANSACVELAMTWKKSSYSTANSDCVELADDGPTVLVRNSKAPDRGTLSLPAGAVASFVAACRVGELDDLAG